MDCLDQKVKRTWLYLQFFINGKIGMNFEAWVQTVAYCDLSFKHICYFYSPRWPTPIELQRRMGRDGIAS